MRHGDGMEHECDEFCADYQRLVCSGCMAVAPPDTRVADASWRWNGEHWKHKCPGQAPQHGHSRAVPEWHLRNSADGLVEAVARCDSLMRRLGAMSDDMRYRDARWLRLVRYFWRGRTEARAWVRDWAAQFNAEMERLARAIDELRARHRWIPVTERLPEPGAEVDIYDPKWGRVPFCSWNGASWDTRRMFDVAPTHWMPQPDPPEAT